MSVSLAVPSYSVTLGGFDITDNITNLSFNYPAVGITVPQAKIGSITLHSRIAADFDDQVLPSRWSRGQQVVIITILGVKAFTGYILFYRYDRQTNIGEGDIGDQLALQNFDRTAVEIPITVGIRDRAESDRYSQLIERQSNITQFIPGIPITYTQQPNTITLSAAPTTTPIATRSPDRFIFQGTDVSEIVYQLVLASGFIEGNQIFSDIARPVLTGDISIPIVATNPIQEAQKYAGADRVFCHTNRDGRIVWKEYPTGGSPIFQLREDDCAVFKPDLTIDRRWFETVIVSGQIDIQVSNPDYRPARTITLVNQGQVASGGGGLILAVPSVTTRSVAAIGDPYLPETIPIAGQAQFTSNGLTPYLPTTENINVGYLYSVPQADRLANFLGNLQLQKANSYLVQIPIQVAWLNNPDPFQICHISDCALIMDAVEIVIEEKMAYMAFTGNKFGTIPTITNPAAPAAIPTPIISATNQQGNLERELSDIGAINTTLSDFFGVEREYSGVGFIVGGVAQWHRSEEALSLAFDNIGVTQWGDLSGNNINFRAIAGAEPNTELLSRLNGKQVISWLTVNDGFFADLISVSSPCEFYIVIRTQAWTGSRRILGAGDLSLTVNGTTLTLTVGTTSLTRTLAVDTWAVVSFAVNGTASYLAVDSSVITGTLPNFASDFLVLGSAAAYRIAEFIRYGFALSSGDRALNLAYLEDRYDLTNRASDPDIVGTPAPIVPTPPVDLSGTYTNATVTVDANGNITDISNGVTGFELNTTGIKTANYTAVSGDRIPCDTIIIGAFTITLPASGVVAIFDVRGNLPELGFGVNALTVDPASNSIMGDTSLELDVGATSVELELIGTEWRIRNGR